MEDNFTNNNTVDQAWEMMRTTLDKEMPEERKRRAIWWIFPLIGMLAIAGFWHFNQGVVTESSPQAPIKSSVINEEKIIAASEVNNNQTEIKDVNLTKTYH